MELDRNPYAAPDSTSYLEEGAFDYGTGQLADRVTRLIAVWIDTFLYAGAIIPGVLVMLATADGSSDATSALAVTAMAIPVLALVIYQWYLVSTTGQTLAKRWMHIRIVRTDGSPVTFVHAVLLRSWVMHALGAVPFIGYFVGIADALMIFGEERRCLHDRIAGTIVVRA